MLTIAVRFLHGTFRADADDVAITGESPRGEWPPSPARLFSALVAGDGTGERCHVSDGSGLRALECAEPPKIYADLREDVLKSRLCERYAVVDKTTKGSVQDYPARTARPVRRGTRLSPKDPQILYVWNELSLTDSAVRDISERAARVGYLGCADSPVSIRLEVTPPNGPAWTPDPSGRASLPVPYPGLLNDLDDLFHRFTSGEVVRRSWYPVRRVRYRAPDESPADEDAAQKPTLIWLRLEPAISGRKVVAVTETLRAAVLEKYEQHVAGSPEDVPRLLHGHGFDGPGYQHVCWFALPDVGHSWSRGRIHGAAVWLPAGTPELVVDGVRTALAHIPELVRPGYFRARLRQHSGEPRPLAARPDRWQRTSHVWSSAFPVVHEQWQTGGPDIDSATRWCEHAGLPKPIGFRSTTVPLIPGAVCLTPNETRRKGKEFRPYSHVELMFAEPVSGPLAIGRVRQFGLGLLAPVDRHTQDLGGA